MGRSERIGALIAAIIAIGLGSSRVHVARGQEETPARGVVSGTITLEDGSPSKTKGLMLCELKEATTPGQQNGSTYSETEGPFKDKFSVKLRPGTAWLKLFADGYAPTAIGPLEIAPGQKIDSARFVLTKGVRRLVRVVSGDDKPVAGAKISAFPVFGPNHNGPNVPVQTNERGEIALEHLADVPYAFLIAARGHEPFRVESQTLEVKGATVFKLTPSQPVTGIVLNADNSPAAGAKVLFRCELRADGSTEFRSYGYGEEFAVTDKAGHFSLDTLATGSVYLFIIESAEKQRVAARTFHPGLEGVQIRLPKEQNLRVKLVGDLSRLQKRKDNRFINVRQRLTIEQKNGDEVVKRSKDLIGVDANVTPTADGGVVDYPGLVSGTVEINAGDERQTFDVVENGLTEVTIELDEDE
jgi:hypothetical protein